MNSISHRRTGWSQSGWALNDTTRRYVWRFKQSLHNPDFCATWFHLTISHKVKQEEIANIWVIPVGRVTKLWECQLRTLEIQRAWEISCGILTQIRQFYRRYSGDRILLCLINNYIKITIDKVSVFRDGFSFTSTCVTIYPHLKFLIKLALLRRFETLKPHCLRPDICEFTCHGYWW